MTTTPLALASMDFNGARRSLNTLAESRSVLTDAERERIRAMMHELDGIHHDCAERLT